MSVTLKNEGDSILWTLAKVLVIFKERHYLFAAPCIWWIAAWGKLDAALQYFLDNKQFPSETQKNIGKQQAASTQRKVSAMPQDIQQRSVSEEYNVLGWNQYQTDPLRRTWKGRIKPLPKTKR